VSYFGDIQIKQSERQRVVKEMEMLIPPNPADSKAIKEHISKVKELAEEHHDYCWGIERQVQVMLYALHQQAGSWDGVELWINHAADMVPVEPWMAARLAEIQEKNRAKRELPGQLRIEDSITAPKEKGTKK
jgi:hypothetical protein